MSSSFSIRRDPATGEVYLTTAATGRSLLEDPILNKGTAFTAQERRAFGLDGLLPPAISTPESQIERIYGNYRTKTTDLERYAFLVGLQDRNETAFYRLIGEHLTEMMPMIYTPVVGAACQAYSRIYHRPRGLYLSYPQMADMESILAGIEGEVAVIVVTDGERILGLGDLGIGGMGIPVGKLALYTACAGIHPASTLPIVLDVGTNNKELLNDPLYLGWRHERVRGADYDAFIEAFVNAVNRRFPKVLLQWEDFANANAGKLLDRYRDRLCTFNDDIQGTGSVTLAAVLSATSVTRSRISEQRVVMFGAGSAGVGIADQIVASMVADGAQENEARKRIWLVDSQGFVHTGRTDLGATKLRYAQPLSALPNWTGTGLPGLLDVVANVHPTILIGTAAQAGTFTEAVVREMARHVERPVILPLSNPTSKCEALPADLIPWTEGRAVVATGSPFAPVEYGGKRFEIGQCNNAYIFPGIGLGVIAVRSPRVTDAMFLAAAQALAEMSPAHADPNGALFPPVSQVRKVSRHVACAVAREARRAGLIEALSDAEIERRVDAAMWSPQYLPYRPVTQLAAVASA